MKIGLPLLAFGFVALALAIATSETRSASAGPIPEAEPVPVVSLDDTSAEADPITEVSPSDTPAEVDPIRVVSPRDTSGLYLRATGTFQSLAANLTLHSSEAGVEPRLPAGFESERVRPGGPGIILNLAVDDLGKIYLGEGRVSGIRVLSPTGELLESFETGSHFISGLAVRDSNLLFASSTRSVMTVTPRAGLLTRIENAFHFRDLQGDLALRGDQLFMVGHFFAQDPRLPPLWRIDTNTFEFARFDTDPLLPLTAVAYDAAADLLIGGTREGLYEIDPVTGEALRFASTGAGLTVYSTELITTNPRLGPVTTLGAERVLREPPPQEPTQLAMHPRTGDVYYGALSGEVLRATRDGEVTRFRSAHIIRVFGLAFHPDGEELLISFDGVQRIRGDFDSIPCEVAYELAEVELGHAGGPPLVEHTLTVHFEGPVVRVHEAQSEHAPNKLFLCPGSRIEFQAESTLGEARCWVSRGTGRRPRGPATATGTLQARDSLVCSNEPEGSDTDVFLLSENRSR